MKRNAFFSLLCTIYRKRITKKLIRKTRQNWIEHPYQNKDNEGQPSPLDKNIRQFKNSLNMSIQNFKILMILIGFQLKKKN